MKPLILGLLISQVALSAQVRALFFYPNESGGKFRLKCQQSSNSNRCSEKIFSQTAKSLCLEKDMLVKSIDPIVCIKDLQTQEQICKFANGSCVQKEESKDKENSSKDREEKKEVSPEGTTSL